MNLKELKKANGDVFFEARRQPNNAFIYVNWIGIQTLETVVMGCNHILAILRHQPCTSILNSNKELIGPWDHSINWLTYKWVPEIKSLGVIYFAHVMGPGIYGQNSFKKFHTNIQHQLKIATFTDEKEAESWLLNPGKS